jgi:uncharacterized protein
VIEQEPSPSAQVPFGFAVGWSALALLGFFVLGGAAQLLNLGWGLWVSEVLIFVPLALTGWQTLRLDGFRALGFQHVDVKGLAIGGVFGFINYFAWAVPLMALSEAVFPKEVVDSFDRSLIFSQPSTLELVLVTVGVVIAAPLGEEAFFRGFLQPALKDRTGMPRAIVVTALIFAAFHGDKVGFLALFQLGVLFGLLRWKSQSLWPAIGAHAANNLISSTLFFLSDASEAELPRWIGVGMWIMGNAALVVAIRMMEANLKQKAACELVDAPHASTSRTLLGFGSALAVSTLVLLTFDWRGVRLNILETRLRLSSEVKKDAEVKVLRAKVREGSATFEDYEAKLKALK